MRVLMVGVGPERVGGMWTVAQCYLDSGTFCEKTELTYIPTSTNGSAVKRSLYMLRGFWKIYWHLKRRKPQIVHIHMAEKGSTFRKGFVAKMAKRNGAKVIIHMHAGPFMAWYQTLDAGNQESIRKIFACADKFFVLGDYWKEQMTELVDSEKLEVLYNGIPIPKENPYSLQSKDIVYFGVFKKEKGIYDLIDAMALIDSRMDPDVKLKLCGKDLEGNVEEYIAQKGLSHRVQMMGWCDAAKRDEILRNAAVDVLPSYFEGLSMTVIEAMAYGVPMLTTGISTMPELLGDGITLVEPGDVAALAENLLKLTQEPALRKQWSQQEYARAGMLFSLEKNIEKTYEVYCSLLQK